MDAGACMEKVGKVGWFYMIDGELDIVKAGMWEVPGDFRCSKPEFAEYLGASASYDQQQRMGQMYWAVREGEVVGYMMLAMGHVGEERQADLGIDTYGPVPALVITRLATDERHERSGIGRRMTYHAVDLAGRMALDVGCRLVLADSDRDAVGFYEKMGFIKFAASPSSSHGVAAPESCSSADSESALVPMYLNLKPRES